MKSKRNLSADISFDCADITDSPLDADINKIKAAVTGSLDSEHSERRLYMKQRLLKTLAVAAAAALVLGASSFAASGLIKSWHSSSSGIADYTTLPTKEQAIKDAGYAPILIEAFGNGYTFAEGSIIKNVLKDENGVAEKFKSFSFSYVNNGDEVTFSQDKFNSDLGEPEGEKTASCNGVDIYYNSYTGKFVPPDYELTEEDKRAEESGELVFSYGTDEVEINYIQSVHWSKDGMRYSLMQINGKLSPGELTAMAKEAIEAE